MCIICVICDGIQHDCMLAMHVQTNGVKYNVMNDMPHWTSLLLHTQYSIVQYMYYEVDHQVDYNYINYEGNQYHTCMYLYGKYWLIEPFYQLLIWLPRNMSLPCSNLILMYSVITNKYYVLSTLFKFNIPMTVRMEFHVELKTAQILNCYRVELLKMELFIVDPQLT